jgi:hypothetical protein
MEACNCASNLSVSFWKRALPRCGRKSIPHLDSEIASLLDVHLLAFHSLYAQRMEQALAFMDAREPPRESRMDDHGAAFYYRHRA